MLELQNTMFHYRQFLWDPYRYTGKQLPLVFRDVCLAFGKEVSIAWKNEKTGTVDQTWIDSPTWLLCPHTV